MVHTHSAAATAWAQAGRAIPPLGTTHADHFHGAVPVTPSLSDAEIDGDYEAETGAVIIRTLSGAGLSAAEMPGRPRRVARAVHLGPDAGRAPRTTPIALELVASIAERTLALDPTRRPHRATPARPPLRPQARRRRLLRAADGRRRTRRRMDRGNGGVDFGNGVGAGGRRRRRRRARSSASAVHAVRQRCHRRAPAVARRRRHPRARLGAAGPRRLRRGAPPGGARRGRRRGRRRRRTSSASGIDFTSCTMLPTTADGTPLCQSTSTAGTRMPGSSCGSTTPPSPRRTRSTGSRPSSASRGSTRYGGRISSEWFFPKALQILRRGARHLRGGGPADRGRRLDRLAADGRRDAQQLHRGLQGPVVGRRRLPGGVLRGARLRASARSWTTR